MSSEKQLSDTAHTDVSALSVDPQEEKRLVRKLDARILPIISLLYLFAFLDRGNLGNARLQGLPHDALGGDPTGHLFDWVNSVFFMSYILSQIPLGILFKLVSPPVWMACIALGWGLSSTLMSTAFDFGGLLAARLFLGIFEAGLGPIIPLYLSLFYTKEELGTRVASYFGFAAVAGAFGGLIAFGLQHAHTAIANWRLLFIIEGVPAVIMGAIALFFLPSRPESTTYLSERERAVALARMNRGTSTDTGATVNKAHVLMAFRDWRIYVGGVIYFGLNCALASISAFLPTILRTFGYTNANAQLLTVPPYAVAAVVMLTSCFTSDRLQTRGIFMCVSSIISGIGFVLLLTVESVHVRYFSVFCIVAGTYASLGVMLAWFSHNMGSETKRSTGTPTYMAIGQCGSILGSHIFPLTEGPRYMKGFGICCALIFLAALLTVVLSISYRMENKRRDQLYGTANRSQRVDMSQLADKAPEFRYLP